MQVRTTLLAAALALTAPLAGAHDTWFEALPGDGGSAQLALGTGSVYPLQESGVDASFVVEQGCRAGRVATTLQPLRNEAAALLLRAAPGASTCWAQLTPFEVTLAPDKIKLYLREVGAGPELRATWAGMQQRGLPWRERYSKHARIELGAPSANPVPLAMDLVIHHSGPVQAGDTLQVQVLRDGRPLPGQAVELRSDSSPLGLWRRSDADGRLQVTVPAPGHWLLRAVDLRLSDTVPDTWDSRFVSLAFQAGVQNGSSLNSNTRSASQMPATSAMASDPPSSTTRR